MGNISTYGYTNIGSRKENEDAGIICLYEKNTVVVIADGLGGQGDGRTASQTAVQSLQQCGFDGRFPGKKAVEEAFQAANGAVLQKQQNQFHMKTTAVYLCIHENKAIWAHIGDSRLYHFWDGSLCHYTLDHSLPQVAVALGEIERREIPGHPKRSCLLRALGNAVDEIETEVHEPVVLEPGKHAFLLCTDGLWEYLDDEEIQDALCRSKSAEIWLQELFGLIRERWESDYDNNTAAAVIIEV